MSGMSEADILQYYFSKHRQEIRLACDGAQAV
jgi:hypothetical protein